jgi:hypothetical protein
MDAPDPSTPNPAGRTTNMGPRQRLTTSMQGAAPWQQLTPDQMFFRNTVGAGRWQADFDTGAHAPANLMRLGPDGTLDTVKLEPDGDAWIDLGGRGATDVAAGRV